MPWVASEACCRNTLSPAILQMSMGIVRRWPGGWGFGISIEQIASCWEDFLGGRRWGSLQAKMVFMIGMYWCARSPETESIRIRGFKVAGWVRFGSEGAKSGSAVVLVEVVVERAMDCLLIYVSARVRAPAMEVVGVRDSGDVVL